MFTDSSAPLVSVVMPVKECNSAFLEASIKSILGQTFTNLELLIIVDNVNKSIDKHLLSVIEKFEKDERLRIISNTKEGFVEALNTGLEVAKGKYIARMDGDDVSLPDRLKLQIDAIEKNNLDLVGGWAYVVDEKGHVIGQLKPPTDPKKIRKLMMLHNPFLHSSIVFKKEILNHSGVYNMNLFGAEDYELWLRIVALGYNCANVPNFVLCLREAHNSIVRGNDWKKTRHNYAKAKAFGLVKFGYHDPLSIICCFATPFATLMDPKISLQIKSFLRWFERKSFDGLK